MIFSKEWQINADSILVKTIDDVSVLVPVDQIIIIAEYTNENGPFCEDHFIVLITENGSVYEMPACQLSIDDQAKLITFLCSPMVFNELIGSTTFTSRCIWPKDVEGREFLDFKCVSLFTVRLDIINDVLAEAKSRV